MKNKSIKENIYNLKPYFDKYNNNDKQIFKYKQYISNDVRTNKYDSYNNLKHDKLNRNNSNSIIHNNNNNIKNNFDTKRYLKLNLYNSKSVDKESEKLIKQRSLQKINFGKNINCLKLLNNENNKKLSQLKYSSPYKLGPFENKKLTNFGKLYKSGAIPVKLVHGHVSLKIEWLQEPEDINFDPLIITCFEGLIELYHPYNFISKQCCIDLLKSLNSRNKIKLLNWNLTNLLRKALIINNDIVYNNAIDILLLYIDIIKEDIFPYFSILIQPLNKHYSNM